MTTTPDWDSRSRWFTTAAIPAPPNCVVEIRDRNGRSVHTAAALLVQGHPGLDCTRVVVAVLNNEGYVVPAMELGEVVYASPGIEHSADVEAFL
jgi:hypothetical protein